MRPSVSCLVGLVLAAVLTGAPGGGEARPQKVPKSIQLSSPCPLYLVSYVYSGAADSVSMKANGFGRAQWYARDGRLAMVYAGSFYEGMMNGPGRAEFREWSLVIEGEWYRGDLVKGEAATNASFADPTPAEPDGADQAATPGKGDSVSAAAPAEIGTGVGPEGGDSTSTAVPAEPDTAAGPGAGFAPVDELPELLFVPEPRYPWMPTGGRASGLVKTLVLVGTDGMVRKARLSEADHLSLIIPAMEAATAARFRPARWKGEPRPVWVSIPIRFHLRQ